MDRPAPLRMFPHGRFQALARRLAGGARRSARRAARRVACSTCWSSAAIAPPRPTRSRRRSRARRNAATLGGRDLLAPLGRALRGVAAAAPPRLGRSAARSPRCDRVRSNASNARSRRGDPKS
jgi:hypothetical protein